MSECLFSYPNFWDFGFGISRCFAIKTGTLLKMGYRKICFRHRLDPRGLRISGNIEWTVVKQHFLPGDNVSHGEDPTAQKGELVLSLHPWDCTCRKRKVLLICSCCLFCPMVLISSTFSKVALKDVHGVISGGGYLWLGVDSRFGPWFSC